MVSGDIKGAKLADGQTKITDGNTILATGRPVISNVNVNQTEAMDGSKYIGIGFFGTITNEVNVNNIGVSAGTVTVSNLELHNVDVKNNTNKHKDTQTIISGLTTLLGGILGGTVDTLLGILTFGKLNLNLKDTLEALLNARAKDPTIYATGAFAGRMVGDVVVEKCDVTGIVSVTNINDRTGGFVGYTEGVTQYEGLSQALGVTVKALSALLNVIPGLGLGDLITILLKNALPVGSLIPTGYKNVNIKNCHVENLAGTIGAADKDYAGGFVGQQVGTRIFDCSVKNSSYSVTAKEYGGGFAGISRDAEIRGLLSDVGVELIRVMQPQSILLNCNLTGCNVTVSGENYQGGIVGAQTNSYAVNCGASGSIAVKASGSYAGGVSGISTVGWITNLGNEEVKDASLLTTVKDLLTGLLSSDPEKAGMLLSLVGIAPSAILGCNMDCSSVSVEAGKSYSGGILGGGDGVYIAESSTEYLNKLPYWKHGGADASSVAQRDNVLTGLKTVTAGENRVGGIAGSVTTANVTGLLNNTLGIGNFLGFTVHHVTVTGVNDGYTVEAKENYAGGALGEAVGGDVDTVTLNQVKSVSAKNRVGGFIGCAGPGDLAGGNGLTLNLLGLNNLLKVKNLLSVAEGVRVKINEAHVNGIAGGMTVEATGANSNGEVVDYTAGGFIGKSNSCEIIKSDVKNLKEVTANDKDGIAGGFVGSSQTGGLADVAGEADVKALLNASKLLGAVTYLLPSYTECKVTYVDTGGVAADTAGGFAGNFQSGTVNNQGAGEGNYYSVYNLDHVNGQSYAGGFGGNVYSGALADAGGGISILGGIKGLNINVGDLLNLINAYIPYVQYAGVKSDNGFTVTANKMKTDDSNSGSAGGFIGYANLARMSNCTAGDKTNQKIGLKQVASGGTAGGFAGRTSFAYLADLKLDSGAVNVIFSVVNQLVKALYLDKIQDSDLLKINLGIIKVDALYDGKLLHVNLLGLDISVGLSKKSTDNNQQTDLAIITIGDSSIKLPCDENGLLNDNDAKSNISVSLIKANRTKITDSNVYGVSQGYDVYAGGAGNNNDGDAKDGRSGGFVGFNDEGLLKNNNMYYCDVVRGTKDLVGPFSGKSELDTVYDFNSQEKVEGEKNNYRIYRKLDQSLDQIEKNNSILNSSHEKDDASGWDIYTIGHMNPVKTFETLKNAVLASKSDSVKADLNAYESPAKAVLMADTRTTLNTGDSDTPEPSESQDPCDENIKLTINKVWKDLNNFDHSRPNSITVTISRTWKDKAGNEMTEPVPGYESYKIEGSIDKSKWQEVIKELPAYKTDGDEIYYYTYSITEAKVDGYTTTIDKSQDGFTFTITNRHFPGLPDTGGYGSYLIYLIAVLLFLIYFVMRYKKCKENKKAEKL